MKRNFFVLAVAFVFFAFTTHSVYASAELRKGANLTTIVEAALSAASLIQDRNIGSLETLSWSADYSERDWVFRANGSIDGKDVTLTMVGYLWGQDKESWNISYTGLGKLGEEAILISGQADWHFDIEVSDYRYMDFRQVMKFGDNSFWGWVLGAETIGGGIIGAGAAVAGSAIATGGVAVGAAPWIAAGGFAAGAASLIGASAAAKSLLESDNPTPRPLAPERRSPPKAGEKLFPTKGIIYTAVSGDGRIKGSGPDGIFVLSGKYEATKGTANGTIINTQ